MATRILTEEDKQDLEGMLGIASGTYSNGKAIRILTEEDKIELEEKIAQAGPKIELEKLTVTPKESTQYFLPKEGSAYSAVTVEKIPGKYQDVSGITTKPEQVLDGCYFMDSSGEMMEGEIPTRSAADLSANGLTVSVPAGYYETDAYKSVEAPDTGDSDLTLVTANVTSTKGTQEVTPNAGEAFSKVIVNPIPDQYQDVSGVTAQPEQVLDGAYFVDSTGARKEGSIPVRSSIDLTATNTTVTVPAGFYEQEITKAVNLEVVEGAGITFSDADVKLNRTNSGILASAVMAVERLLPAGTTIEFQMSNGRFGNAKKTDVVYGATFTSENGLNISGTKPVDQGNNTVAEGTAEAASLADLYYWEKSAVAETITEETVSDYQLWYKSSYGTQSVTYGFSQYAQEIAMEDGALVLVNPQSRDGVANSDYDTVLPGKYIQSGTTIYRIPADAVISTYQTTGATRITVDRAFKMTLVSVGGRSIVVSDDSSMFPTNGEQEGYTYVYQGTLNALAKDAVIQALTVTENGTYTPPDGVDGYGPVTVEVPSGGVELPDIAEEERGTAYDLADGKKLIAPDGTVVTGMVPVEDSDFYFEYTKILYEGSDGYLSPYYHLDHDVFLRNGIAVYVDVPAKDYGHAEPGDVRVGKTFTSKEGFCIRGNAVFPGETYHHWKKYNHVFNLVETEKSGVVLSSQAVLSGDYFDAVQYADDVVIVDGGISLVEDQSLYIDGTDDISTILGKYIYSERNGEFYRIPSDATVSSSGTQSTKISVSTAFSLSVEASKGGFLEDVFWNEADTYPENGIQDGYWYVYQGLQEGPSGKDPVIQALTVTENGTYTPPDGVDGYSPVTVSVPIPDGYIKPSGTLNIKENGTHNVTNYASVNVNVATSSGYKSGDIVKAFPASATLASGYNVSSVSASDSVTKDENGVVSLSGVTSTVAIGSIDNVKGRYVKASSGSIYYVPADATITQGGTSYSKTYTADKANLMVVLA